MMGDPSRVTRKGSCELPGCDSPIKARRLCNKHYMRAYLSNEFQQPLPEERFMLRVEVDEDGCWNWIGKRNHYGYGRFWLNGQEHMAHRWAYERWVGPIPEGLVLDHFFCHRGMQGCANPFHCRPETLERNSADTSQSRKTHCKWGHEYTPENTYRNPTSGTRACRTCIKRRSKK